MVKYKAKQTVGQCKNSIFVFQIFVHVSGSATYATALQHSALWNFITAACSANFASSGLEEKPNFYGYTKLINLMFPQQIFKFAWSISTVWKMDISAIKMTEF